MPRSRITLASTALLATLAFGAPAAVRAQPARDSVVRAEIRELYREITAARRSRDRAAIERLYAPEFVWVHAAGYVDDRAALIEDWFSMDSVGGGGGLQAPSFDPPNELLVYGDVAVHRHQGPTRLADAVWGSTTYVKRGGRWQIVQITGTTLLPPRQRAAVDPATLDAYAGRYARGNGVFTVIERRGDGLVVRHPGLPARVLTPVSAARFYDKVGGEWTFQRDGETVTFTLRSLNGREGRGTKAP